MHTKKILSNVWTDPRCCLLLQEDRYYYFHFHYYLYQSEGGGCSVKRVPIFRYLRLAGLDPAGLRLDNTARGPFLAGPVFLTMKGTVLVIHISIQYR